MTLTRHIGQILTAVIVMAALLGAPSIAFAHAGHDHTEANRASASVGDNVSPEAAKIRVQNVAAKAAVLSDIPAKKRCTGGCCSSASGHACCGVSLSASPDANLANDVSAAHFLADPPLRNGLQPEALRKPPRTFA